MCLVVKQYCYPPSNKNVNKLIIGMDAKFVIDTIRKGPVNTAYC